MEIDCSKQPHVSRNLTIQTHLGVEIINFDLSRLKAIRVSTKLKPNEATIKLSQVIERFHRNRQNLPADANVFDAMAENLEQIPKRFCKRGVHLIFIETTYWKKGGATCVRALNYIENYWSKTIIINSNRLGRNDYVVCV